MQQCHRQLCPLMQRQHSKINGGPKEERDWIAHLLKIMGELLQDSASSPEASSYCRTAVALLETGNHTKLWWGLPAQEARVGRRKSAGMFCLL